MSDYKNKLWLIWSNEHRRYWKPARLGYTDSPSEAGRYTFEEAAEICAEANEHQYGDECMLPAPESTLKPRAKLILLFANGQSAVCDFEGKQIPELQVPWLLVFLKFIQEHTGQAPDEIEEIRVPSSRVVVFRTPDGWNWRDK